MVYMRLRGANKEVLLLRDFEIIQLNNKVIRNGDVCVCVCVCGVRALRVGVAKVRLRFRV